MPADTKPFSELDQLAFEIFKAGVATSNRPGEPWAVESYRKAEIFLAIRGKIQSGTVKATLPDGPQLADACAPNLKPTHPLNLISQRFGDLKKVNRIQAYMTNNKVSPTVDDPDEEMLARLKREFPECDSWKKEDLSTARIVFPSYVKAAVTNSQ